MPTKYLQEWLKVWLKFQADSIEGKKKKVILMWPVQAKLVCPIKAISNIQNFSSGVLMVLT